MSDKQHEKNVEVLIGVVDRLRDQVERLQDVIMEEEQAAKGELEAVSRGLGRVGEALGLGSPVTADEAEEAAKALRDCLDSVRKALELRPITFRLDYLDAQRVTEQAWKLRQEIRELNVNASSDRSKLEEQRVELEELRIGLGKAMHEEQAARNWHAVVKKELVAVKRELEEVRADRDVLAAKVKVDVEALIRERDRAFECAKDTQKRQDQMQSDFIFWIGAGSDGRLGLLAKALEYTCSRLIILDSRSDRCHFCPLYRDDHCMLVGLRSALENLAKGESDDDSG